MPIVAKEVIQVQVDPKFDIQLPDYMISVMRHGGQTAMC